MSASATTAIPTAKKVEKKETTKKIDPHKFSKMLVTHCIDNQIEMPPPAFFEDLDKFANGTYFDQFEQMDEEIESQETQDSQEEDFSSAQDEYYLTASRPAKEARRK